MTLHALATMVTDELVLFELSASLVVHYQQNWYETYPSEPTRLLIALDAIV